MRIVTLTLNPSLDRTLEVEHLTRGAVLRATGQRVEPGGKGVNVARALAGNSHAVSAVVPAGGAEGDHLIALLVTVGLDVKPVAVAEATRTNVSVVEPDGTVTKLNAAGHRLTEDEVAAVEEAVVSALDGADWVAACGSLPPGVPADLYAAVTRMVHGAGVRVAVDTSGTALREAITAGPDVIKPNHEELADATGRRLQRLGDVIEAAQTLRAQGVGTVLVSLGRHGAVLVDPRGTAHAETAPVTPVSNVGAGDATLAGFLAGGGEGPDALRTAVAWGTAAVRLPGTAMPTPADIDLDAVAVHDVDPARPLDH